jgi:hypothetical protein
LPRVAVEIVGDASALSRSYKQATAATTQHFGKQVEGIHGSVKSLHSSLLGMASLLVGGGGVVVGFKSMVEAAKAAQESR